MHTLLVVDMVLSAGSLTFFSLIATSTEMPNKGITARLDGPALPLAISVLVNAGRCSGC